MGVAGARPGSGEFLARLPPQVGSVELLPASSCEAVVNRGGCACSVPT
jgi:hypothetical protein